MWIACDRPGGFLAPAAPTRHPIPSRPIPYLEAASPDAPQTSARPIKYTAGAAAANGNATPAVKCTNLDG